MLSRWFFVMTSLELKMARAGIISVQHHREAE